MAEDAEEQGQTQEQTEQTAPLEETVEQVQTYRKRRVSEYSLSNYWSFEQK